MPKATPYKRGEVQCLQLSSAKHELGCIYDLTRALTTSRTLTKTNSIMHTVDPEGKLKQHKELCERQGHLKKRKKLKAC